MKPLTFHQMASPPIRTKSVEEFVLDGFIMNPWHVLKHRDGRIFTRQHCNRPVLRTSVGFMFTDPDLRPATLKPEHTWAIAEPELH